MEELDYKGYVLLTTEIPNFNSAGLVQNSKLYRGSSTINGEKWVRDACSLEVLEELFRLNVDSLSKPMTYKEQRIKDLEIQLLKISAELEKVRNEKEVLTYKEVVLQLIPEKDNWFSGIIKNAPKNTCSFYGDEISIMIQDFQRYIDDLEESTHIYCQLTGKELYTPEKPNF